MFISKFVNWLTEKKLLHQSRRWRREKLVNLFEVTYSSEQPKQQALVEEATVSPKLPTPKTIKQK
ncbi:hypothetical protein [Sulfuriferula nivalis]|uniref:hypothetical protein n=1 Tax=Sulfuriferula nivalis TaxID=2675298 RepID=UPI0013896299|nr:hypothetical protein [Sulfuriferula nivalis]